jgi:membrane protein DedA with SNARE-associated domain
VTDVAAAYGMAGWPFWAVVAGLFVVVMARSHLFYWLGRGVLGGARRIVRTPDAGATHAPAAEPAGGDAGHEPAPRGANRRVERLLGLPPARRGLALVHRWGPLAVTAAYLTVGLQTAVFVASGLVRMPYARFVVASVPGSVAWAFVWGTVGLGAVWAAVRLAAASPWALAGVLVLAAAVVVVVARRRRRARVAA